MKYMDRDFSENFYRIHSTFSPMLQFKSLFLGHLCPLSLFWLCWFAVQFGCLRNGWCGARSSPCDMEFIRQRYPVVAVCRYRAEDGGRWIDDAGNLEHLAVFGITWPQHQHLRFVQPFWHHHQIVACHLESCARVSILSSSDPRHLRDRLSHLRRRTKTQ